MCLIRQTCSKHHQRLFVGCSIIVNPEIIVYHFLVFIIIVYVLYILVYCSLFSITINCLLLMIVARDALRLLASACYISLSLYIYIYIYICIHVWLCISLSIYIYIERERPISLSLYIYIYIMCLMARRHETVSYICN